MYCTIVLVKLITDANSTELKDSNVTIIQSSIEIPVDVFPDSNFTFVLNHYATNVLFPLNSSEFNIVNSSEFNIVTDTEVIGFGIPEEPNITNLNMPVKITLQSLRGRRGEASVKFRFIVVFCSLC